MCGFIGRILSGNREVPEIEKSYAFLGRRGPDSHSTWRTAGKEVELLHARLAVVDQDDSATQPLESFDTQVCVAFNGEIYNYDQLKNELADYPFRTQSDTEVILAAYQKWGLESFRRFRGMFSLALVDRAKKTVVLVRDPIGKKPLFLARWNGNLYFGSSILALASVSGERVELDSAAAQQFFDEGNCHPTQSHFRNCEPVLPGEIRIFDWHGKEISRSDCRPSLETFSGDLQLVRERLGELLRSAVSRRLHNNPRPVSLLSGGIDSTVITKLMKEAGKGDAVTLGSVIPLELDEKYARYAAWKMEIPLKVVRANLGRFADEARWVCSLQDEPQGTLAFFPLALLIRAVKSYGKILLTGDGGDEVFLGYGKPGDWIRGEKEIIPPSLAVGPPLPDWMSAYGVGAATTSLLGHNLAKLDRASAEQGVEARCPLLDWEVMALTRQLSPEQLFFTGTPKSLLKDQLVGWPKWFVERPKVGFAYRIRYAWGIRRFEGLRELVSEEAVQRFAPQFKSPMTWSIPTIFRNFPTIWKLVCWTQFEERVKKAESLRISPPIRRAA